MKHRLAILAAILLATTLHARVVEYDLAIAESTQSPRIALAVGAPT